MYNSKSLLSTHGRLEVNVVLEMKNGSKFVETGSSQSVNVKRHINQMIEESVLNALYKLNHRRGERVFNKNNYNDDIASYLKSYRILSYKMQYFEDRRYSYKRESRDGKYKFVTYRDGEEHLVESPEYLTPKKRLEKQTQTFTDETHYSYKKKDKKTEMEELQEKEN